DWRDYNYESAACASGSDGRPRRRTCTARFCRCVHCFADRGRCLLDTRPTRHQGRPNVRLAARVTNRRRCEQKWNGVIPLLASPRGGEFALFKRSPPPHIAVSAALDAPLNDLRYRPCRLRISQSKRNAITGSRPVMTYMRRRRNRRFHGVARRSRCDLPVTWTVSGACSSAFMAAADG